ncbi:MAG: M81 family metallopeptidase [Sorangiineae bacterium]|nr:M81 family metallopeptidase [Polyangiaceae bacterium]MEB2323013.1 M81 family metallopeptidase [Sorangiineae bacterium]
MIRLGRGGRPLRIGYGRIFHEANAYSPIRTVRADFERLHQLEGAELARAASLRGQELAAFMPHAELTGFVQAARAAGGVEAVPLTSSFAVPSGPLTRECFDSIVAGLADAARSAGPLDGIYLALHGSMQVDGLGEAPETVIIRRVREAAPGARIAVSYDLHANLSSGMVDPTEVMVAYRTNPHWDFAPTGFRAGNRLIRALRGQVRPVHAWRKLPMVLGGGMTIDFLAPMRGVFRWMRHLERDPRVLTASLFMVHPYTAAKDLGWAAHVCTDGDRELAERLADQLAERAWKQRDVPMPPLRGVDAALDEVRASGWRRLGPVTLVDVDDIVGAGAPGGNTHIVEALARDDRGLKAFVPVHDPDVALAAFGEPIGTRRRFTLRGTPGYGQPEVNLDATVAARTEGEFGRTVRLDTGSFHVVVSERSPLPIHPSFWAKVGLAARDADLIVQKNFFHYRLFYATTSFRHLPVVSDGATSFKRVLAGPYELPRHPSTRISDWRTYDEALRNSSFA